jgi:hypothetical protein
VIDAMIPVDVSRFLQVVIEKGEPVDQFGSPSQLVFPIVETGAPVDVDFRRLLDPERAS